MINRFEADDLLSFLEDYTKLHFNHEETCMARLHCSAFKRNMEDHDLFMNILKFAKAEYEVTDKTKDVLKRLHVSMVWWINQHIINVDIKLKECSKMKKAVG